MLLYSTGKMKVKVIKVLAEYHSGVLSSPDAGLDLTKMGTLLNWKG